MRHSLQHARGSYPWGSDPRPSSQLCRSTPRQASKLSQSREEGAAWQPRLSLSHNCHRVCCNSWAQAVTERPFGASIAHCAVGRQLLKHRIDPQRRKCGMACNKHMALIPGGRALVFCVGSPRPVPVGQHSWTNECAQALLSMARVIGKQTHQVASTQINEVTATLLHAMDRKKPNTEPTKACKHGAPAFPTKRDASYASCAQRSLQQDCQWRLEVLSRFICFQMLSTSAAIAKSIPSQSLETNLPVSPSSQLCRSTPLQASKLSQPRKERRGNRA